MNTQLNEIVEAIKTKTGINALVMAVVPFVNPWLVSHGYPSFYHDAVQASTSQPSTSSVGSMGWVLAGATILALRAAIKKSQIPK